MKRKYAIIIESGPNNYSAYVPDVPGCITTGRTVAETVELMREALEFHFEGMREDGDAIPEPTSLCEYVEVEIPEPAATEPPRR
ncbi:MAG TPA: type II toxin-antitoxin system HicB family antitoxin [Bryobacteraceae bacterium]|nr:type II toxin-antitoxin system HicB family antitoxin [Bryobacteraceae bacterium]